MLSVYRCMPKDYQSYPMSMSIAGEVAAIVLIINGFPLYKAGLAKLKLSIAQPVYSSVLFLTTILLSVVVFHDAIHINEIIGLGILVLGIFIVIRTSGTGEESST